MSTPQAWFYDNTFPSTNCYSHFPTPTLKNPLKHSPSLSPVLIVTSQSGLRLSRTSRVSGVFIYLAARFSCRVCWYLFESIRDQSKGGMKNHLRNVFRSKRLKVTPRSSVLCLGMLKRKLLASCLVNKSIIVFVVFCCKHTIWIFLRLETVFVERLIRAHKNFTQLLLLNFLKVKTAFKY